MNVAIVEDLEEDSLWLSDKIDDYMKKSGISYTLYRYATAEDFVNSLDMLTYSVVFMDIYLGEMTGMDAAVMLRRKDRECRIVFLTVSEDYALQGYSVNASHYLIKPVREEKFLEAMENCCIEPAYSVPYLDVMVNGVPNRLHTGSIMYINLHGRTVHIHTTYQTFVVNGAFRTITEPLLADGRFLQSIQSVMINMDYISGYDGNMFIMTNGTHLPINVRNRKQILKYYHDYIFENMGGTL